MKKLMYVCVLLIAGITTKAKDIKYPVSAIPAELKQNVNAVVRLDESIFKITSKNSSSVHNHFVITIFNANAKRYAETVIGYDKMRKIKDIKAAAYDQFGESIKKIKYADITDQAAFDGVSLFSDNRLKYFDLAQPTYPYTVEVEYDIEYDFLCFIDGATVLGSENISVEHFKYQLIYPTSLKPRYRTLNIETKPVVASPSSNTESLTWTIDNILPLKIEPMSPRSRYLQEIEVSPNDFELSGYSGSMSSWKSIGSWLSTLNQGRDKLPEETKRKIHQLTAGLKTNEEKAKVLYEYMQSKTRYVSIQLGIGGWQPFEASTVDQTGYGDCKALSNYMVAMLKEVNVPAYYAIITGSRTNKGFDPSFPTNRANHAVVAVPTATDTLWLECTSQTSPFAYTSDFIDNRYALLVTENGGKLVKTTYYPGEKNVQSRIADVTLDVNGNAKAKVTTTYSGLQYGNDGLEFIVNQSTDDQKKWIQRTTQIPNFDVGQFTLINKKDKIPTAVVKMDLTLNKLASVSNKRIFLTPNLMNKSSFIPEKIDNRKTPFILGQGFIDIDTIKYQIPESIYPEFLPPTTKLSSRFGTYESGFKLDAGSLIYYRKMTRKDGQYPAESYQELIDFYKSVNKADNTKIVFLSKT